MDIPQGKSAYLICGDDEFRVSRATKELLDALVPESDREFGLESVDGRVGTVDETIAVIRSVRDALVSDQRRVCRSADAVSFHVDESKRPRDYAADRRRSAAKLRRHDLVNSRECERRISKFQSSREHLRYRYVLLARAGIQRRRRGRAVE